MRLEFLQPRQFGKIEPHLLDLLKIMPHESETSATVDARAPQLSPLFEGIAKVAGITLAEHHMPLARSSIMLPGQKQIPLGWHTDLRDYLTANYPTEFLVGDNEAIERLLDQLPQFKDGLAKYDLNWAAKLVADAANMLPDEELLSLNFSFWRPEPYEVVASFEQNPHRPFVNNTEEPIDRQFALLAVG